MAMYPELAMEAKRRQAAESYIDIIPTSIRLDYIDSKGRTRFVEQKISAGMWKPEYIDYIIDQIESEHDLPLRRKD